MIDAVRFYEKVSKGSGDRDCWTWIAGVDNDGNGRFRHDGRPRLAHVIAWEIEHGAVPAGRKVHRVSTCPTRGCVRPDHLTLGDQRSAIKARDARGNAPAGERNAAAKLTADKAREMRTAAAAGTSTRELAERYGLHTTTVSDIVAGRLWASAAQAPAPAPPRPRPTSVPPSRRVRPADRPQRYVPNVGGRPPRAFNREEAQRLRATGASIRAIAETLGVPKSTVSDALSDNLSDNLSRSGKDSGKDFGKKRTFDGGNGR